MYAYGKKMKALSVGLAAVMALAPVAARAQTPPPVTSFQNIPVTSVDGTTFVGTFSVNQFQAVGGQLLAVGTLTGTLQTAAGAQQVSKSVAWPVQQIDGKTLTGSTPGGRGGNQTGSLSPRLDVKPAAFHPPPSFGGSPQSHPGIMLAQTCDVLDLVLGPLHLDLLGLVVDLNQVHLQITAQGGSGNLLGNLLCAVANLLNGGGGGISGLLAGIAQLLNQILAALGGL